MNERRGIWYGIVLGVFFQWLAFGLAFSWPYIFNSVSPGPGYLYDKIKNIRFHSIVGLCALGFGPLYFYFHYSATSEKKIMVWIRGIVGILYCVCELILFISVFLIEMRFTRRVGIGFMVGVIVWMVWTLITFVNMIVYIFPLSHHDFAWWDRQALYWEFRNVVLVYYGILLVPFMHLGSGLASALCVWIGFVAVVLNSELFIYFILAGHLDTTSSSSSPSSAAWAMQFFTSSVSVDDGIQKNEKKPEEEEENPEVSKKTKRRGIFSLYRESRAVKQKKQEESSSSETTSVNSSYASSSKEKKKKEGNKGGEKKEVKKKKKRYTFNGFQRKIKE